MFFKKVLFQQFFHLTLPLLITICCIRLYEYFSVASKVFVDHAWRYEVAGLAYDVWLWLICCFPLFILFALLSFNNRTATFVIHILNVFIIICCISLIMVFSERNAPFDHEFFTRSTKESIQTARQMMTSGVKVYLPFAIYLLVYFTFYKAISKRRFATPVVIVFTVLILASVALVSYSNPSRNWFDKVSAYYLTCNKLTYWMADSYQYLSTEKNNSRKITDAQLAKEIDFYQQHQPFEFTSKEYPLLHEDTAHDVLGSFFNFNKTPPNIVILVVEGLSRDFSGKNAYSGSFTPFLDSLSEHSLTWDNFLSTAPGTFEAHPSISGSLPYGQNGFSIMNVMPDHLSLIKILKANGYYTNFMIGFNPDFDNMGGYIRLQGTDFILTNYPAKYKEMGVGKEGWSMGYPDDALYPRSFQALDSIHKSPYLSIYHTATTHMPYLFEQKPIYEKLFDKKLATMKVSADMRRTLKETEEVLVTFMFSDDCIKQFFADYSKRPEYNNTIFLITGDHHIGSFPSTCTIDDYHVPFIVYSPMLKKPQRFLSVNSHLEITPTILTMLFKNFDLPKKPKEVHWLGNVMDTCTTFRNTHSMAFIEWSRDISDYIYKDYFVSDDKLYKLTPDLIQQPYSDDSLKNFIIRLRENFKIINSYVCNNNKIYPYKDFADPGEKELLKEYNDPDVKLIYSKLSDTALMPVYKIPEDYKFLYVETDGKVNLSSAEEDHHHHTLRMALIDNMPGSKKFLYWSKRDVVTLSKSDFVPQKWNSISTNDMFPLDDYRKAKNLSFELAIWTDSVPINFKLQDLKVKIYGIKSK